MSLYKNIQFVGGPNPSPLGSKPCQDFEGTEKEGAQVVRLVFIIYKTRTLIRIEKTIP
jgi:hypothetical protein